jgi:hypothetical protein
MEKKVAELLLEQKKLKRLNLELPPNKLLLLQRLLYRLGYTNMNRRTKSIKYSELVNTDLNKPGIYGKSQSSIRGWKVVRGYKPVKHNGKYIWQSAGEAVPHSEAEHGDWDKLPEARELIGKPLSEYHLWMYGLGGKAPEAEGVDWRPDETIPEDYYSMHRRTKPIEFLKKKGRPAYPRSNNPKRYARFPYKEPAHPLVRGFPIEYALRHIANSKHSTPDARNLAVAVLRGHAEALWGLHDELNHSKHPILKAKYNWLNAVNKLHLDQHTYSVLRKVSEENRPVTAINNPFSHSPEYYAVEADSDRRTKPGTPRYDRSRYIGIFNRIKQLSPESSDKEIEESIQRHAYRGLQEAARNRHGSPPYRGVKSALNNPHEKSDNDPTNKQNEIATRYKKKKLDYNKLTSIGKLLSKNGAMPGYGQIFVKGSHVWYVGGDGDNWGKGNNNLPIKKFKEVPGVSEVTYEAEVFPKQNDGWVRISNGSLRDNGKRLPRKYSLANKSNFIGALLKASSPEHKIFVQRTRELAKKVGAQKTKQFPALHDTPTQSVPGVAVAVYGRIQPNAAHALGSWVNGLLPNSPGYGVFHVRPSGPDTLYRLRMQGSGYETRVKLDRFGIMSRIFVPHKKGLDILLPDKGNQNTNTIHQFAKQQKVPIEASQGHFFTVGSQDQAQARDTFRNKIMKHENDPIQQRRNRLLKRYALGKPPVPKFPKVIDSPKTSKWHDPALDMGMEAMYGPANYSPPPRVNQEEDPAGYHSLPYLPEPQKTTVQPSPLTLLGKVRGGDEHGLHQLPYLPESHKTAAQPTPPNNSQPPNDQLHNTLDSWAHNHATTHARALAKFLGLGKKHIPVVHNLLKHAIINAAMKAKQGNNNWSWDISGHPGKKLKINIGKHSPGRNLYSRRRRTFRGYK